MENHGVSVESPKIDTDNMALRTFFFKIEVVCQEQSLLEVIPLLLDSLPQTKLTVSYSPFL